MKIFLKDLLNSTLLMKLCIYVILAHLYLELATAYLTGLESSSPFADIFWASFVYIVFLYCAQKIISKFFLIINYILLLPIVFYFILRVELSKEFIAIFSWVSILFILITYLAIYVIYRFNVLSQNANTDISNNNL